MLGFWFDELGPDRWFAKDPALDAAIADRFGALRDAVLAEHAQGWRNAPDTLMAAVLLLDQFGRNIHRGSAQAFAADPRSRTLSIKARRFDPQP